MKRYVIKNGKFAGSRKIEGVTTKIQIGDSSAKIDLVDYVTKRFVNETRNQLIKRIRVMHQDLVGYTIGDYKGEYGTPIDTGRAANSWRLSAGNLDETVAPKDSSSYLSKEQAISKQQYRMRFFTALGDTVYFTNALPYVYELEYESRSKQNSLFFTKALNKVIEEYT